MLEVYAMGIIVAYVKMMDPGEVSVASGTYCLVGLLLCSILCSQYFHEEQAWQYWEQRS
jgi:paraquat-inducible protein A